MSEPNRHNLYSAASFFERYVLSIIYLYLAWVEWGWLKNVLDNAPVTFGVFSPYFAQGVQHFIVLLMQLLIGALLLNSHPSVAEPRNLREIFVPLAACFYFVLYQCVARLPPYWSGSLVDNQVRGPLALVGLTLGVIGPIISFWAVISLGKSFGVFVSVREVVLHGPYRYVRHPIYLGYFCIWIGLLLSSVSRAIFCLVPLHIALVVYRARLEEARLAEASPAYREYMRKTGFLWPRIGGGVTS